MKNIFLSQRSKKNRGSVLVGVVSCVLLFFFCLSMMSAIYLDTLHAIHLEKMQRIGKIMIHTVWHDLRQQEELSNRQVLFNVGVVNIEVFEKTVILTSHLHEGYRIEQVFARKQAAESTKEKSEK